jgi:hypothetical protein
MTEITKAEFEKTLLPKVDHLTYRHVKTHGSITARVAKASRTGAKDRPLRIDFEPHPLCLDQDDKPLHYLPCKGMRIVIAEAWGTEPSTWIGRDIHLVGNPDVMYGGKKEGGIQIANLSHIEKPLTVMLTVSRGKKEPFHVGVLKTETPDPPKKSDPIPAFRSWLEAKGLTEAAACQQIEGRTLEQASEADWQVLRGWAREQAKGATEP